MKKRELKKRIEDGFSQLAPDVFDAVMETVEEQKLILSEDRSEEAQIQTAKQDQLLQPEVKVPVSEKWNLFQSRKSFRNRFYKYAFSACASFVMLFLCIYGALGIQSNTIYMILDINPSIQVEMNQSYQVKRLKGLNQDGRDVVKKLKWKKKESVQDVMDVLIENVVEQSYLKDNGGILVTFCTSDENVPEELEHILGERIDQKLTELEISGVTTAFQKSQDSSAKEGRKLLEKQIMKECDLSEEHVNEMSVLELIEYCRNHTSLELKTSDMSKDEKDIPVKQNEEQKKSKDSSSGKDSDKNKDNQKKENGKQNQEKPKAEEKDKEKNIDNKNVEEVKPKDNSANVGTDQEDNQQTQGTTQQQSPESGDDSLPEDPSVLPTV